MDFNQSFSTPNLFYNDGDADILNGGAGNDNIYISAFDTATGGDGTDIFHVDADGALDDGSPAIITDWEALDNVDLFYSGSDTPTVVDEDGDAVVYLDGSAVLIALGAGGVLTDADFGAAT